MWRLCKLGYRHEPSLMLVAFVRPLISALPDSLMACRRRSRRLPMQERPDYLDRLGMLRDQVFVLDQGCGPVSSVRWRSAAWHTMAWAVFGADPFENVENIVNSRTIRVAFFIKPPARVILRSIWSAVYRS